MTPATAPPLRRRVLPYDPYVADGAVALVVASISMLVDLYGPDGRTTDALAFDVALALPLLLRRRAPGSVTAVIAAVCLLQWLSDVPATGPLALLVMLYTLGAWAYQRWLLPAAVVIAEIGVVLATVRWTPGRQDGITGLMLTGTVTAAWVIGVYVRTRRSYLASMLERAETAERDRDAQARIAVADERARIAREMHDIIAHSLSVMITLNDAAAAIDPSPRVRQTVTQASEVGRQALSEMQRMLTVLRSDDPPDLVPQPGLAQLTELVSQVRSTGMAVQMAVTGEPPEAPATAQLALYRIVQESLTNVLKHGRNVGHVNVDVTYQPRDVTVSVTNDGDTVPAVDISGSAGHGLHGMHERAALYGGTVQAAPQPDGGWKVTAHLHLADLDADPNHAGNHHANPNLAHPYQADPDLARVPTP